MVIGGQSEVRREVQSEAQLVKLHGMRLRPVGDVASRGIATSWVKAALGHAFGFGC